MADLSWGLHWTVGNINIGALHAIDRVVLTRISELLLRAPIHFPSRNSRCSQVQHAMPSNFLCRCVWPSCPLCALASAI